MRTSSNKSNAISLRTSNTVRLRSSARKVDTLLEHEGEGEGDADLEVLVEGGETRWESLDKNVLGLIFAVLCGRDWKNARATCQAWNSAQHPALEKRIAAARFRLELQERRNQSARDSAAAAKQRALRVKLSRYVIAIGFFIGVACLITGVLIALHGIINGEEFASSADGTFIVRFQRLLNSSAHTCLEPIRPVFSIRLTPRSESQAALLHEWFDFRCAPENVPVVSNNVTLFEGDLTFPTPFLNVPEFVYFGNVTQYPIWREMASNLSPESLAGIIVCCLGFAMVVACALTLVVKCGRGEL